MGPLLVLVSPSFRENVNVTCKIVSFLSSLDNFLPKKFNCVLLGNQISKWHPFEKMAIFDLLFTFFSHQENDTKFLQHISHLHKYTYFARPVNFFFCLPNFEKKCEVIMYGFSLTLILFRAILEQ